MQPNLLKTSNVTFEGYITQYRNSKEYGVEDTDDNFDLKVLQDLNFRMGKRDLVDVDSFESIDLGNKFSINVNGHEVTYKFNEIKLTLPTETDTFELTIPRPYAGGQTNIEKKIERMFESIRQNISKMFCISDNRLIERSELDIKEDPDKVIDTFSQCMEIDENELYSN